MTKKINVAFSSDDNYAQHMAVSIVSMLKNASTNSEINIFILYNSLTQKNLEKIKKIGRAHPACKIDFFKLNDEDFKDYPLQTGLHSIATYFRLKLPSMLPLVDKILYLDSDIIVRGDITNMWDFDLEDHLLAGIEEPRMLNRHRLADLGMKDSSPYINGGILFLNLEKMRSSDFEKKCQDFVERKGNILLYQDQDLLNVMAEFDLGILPLRFNSFYYVLEERFYDFISYSQQDIKIAKENPFIIHYNQHPKPWSQECFDPRAYYYFKYLIYTPYQYFYFTYTKNWVRYTLRKSLYNFLIVAQSKFPSTYKMIKNFKNKFFAK